MLVEILAGATVATVLFLLVRPRQTSQDRDRIDVGEGCAPYAEPLIIDGANWRMIDLRSLPRDELARGRGLKVIVESLRLESPMKIHVWVVSPDVVDAWYSLSPAATVVIVSNLKSAAKEEGRNILVSPQRDWTVDDLELLGELGVEASGERTLQIDGTEIELEELLPTPKEASGPVRPILESFRYGLPPRDIVFGLKETLFVDFRRASLAAIQNDVVFQIADEGLTMVTETPARVVWIIPAWIIELWEPKSEAVINRLGELVSSVEPVDGHARVLCGVPDDSAFVSKLKSLGLQRASTSGMDLIEMKTPEVIFRVPLPTALRDAYMHRAISS